MHIEKSFLKVGSILEVYDDLCIPIFPFQKPTAFITAKVALGLDEVEDLQQ